MAYVIGQKVCLWQEDIRHGMGVVVLKEVIVTVTEIKTGVPGHWSRTPVSSQSLRGIGDDGKVYEKHWESWPESQTNCFTDQWSMRDDGEGDDPYWTPKEAVYAYNDLSRYNSGREVNVLVRTDVNGNSILPKGDFVHCAVHDLYGHSGQCCFKCLIEG
jgi:hypothetical protein